MRRCEVDNCTRPHRAKGLCATHYNQQMPPAKRHPKVTERCAWCDAEVGKDRGRSARYSHVYCDLVCRDAHRRCSAEPVCRWEPMPQARPLPERHPAVAMQRLPAPRLFVAASCADCGEPFLLPQGWSGGPPERVARYCSTRCFRRTHKAIRRARKRAAFVAPVSRYAVWLRDRGVCGICGDDINLDHQVPHPGAFVLDHVVPLARGGTHEPANVQAAHFMCNAIKGDRSHAA